MSDWLVPIWATAPTCSILMIAVAAHAERTRRSAEPESRKRIRMANSLLIMLMLPMLVAGLSVLDPDRRPREWAMLWLIVMGLVSISVGLAILDALNTIRLLRRAQRELRRSLLHPPRPADLSPEHPDGR